RFNCPLTPRPACLDSMRSFTGHPRAAPFDRQVPPSRSGRRENQAIQPEAKIRRGIPESFEEEK
ncbi:hypothetical protein, partial [Nitrosospira multiformis]|uniref:hypothetical protein n=1 Tax=Nitrosospira multiformis TaxID=1231 RepID=UPI001CA50751